MSKTAVEWLIDEHFGGIENCTPDFRMRIKQAEEIFEQQIIDACNAGFYDGLDISKISKTKYKSAEHYYNETFKQNQNG